MSTVTVPAFSPERIADMITVADATAEGAPANLAKLAQTAVNAGYAVGVEWLASESVFALCVWSGDGAEGDVFRWVAGRWDRSNREGYRAVVARLNAGPGARGAVAETAARLDAESASDDAWPVVADMTECGECDDASCVDCKAEAADVKGAEECRVKACKAHDRVSEGLKRVKAAYERGKAAQERAGAARGRAEAAAADEDEQLSARVAYADAVVSSLPYGSTERTRAGLEWLSARWELGEGPASVALDECSEYAARVEASASEGWADDDRAGWDDAHDRAEHAHKETMIEFGTFEREDRNRGVIVLPSLYDAESAWEIIRAHSHDMARLVREAEAAADAAESDAAQCEAWADAAEGAESDAVADAETLLALPAPDARQVDMARAHWGVTDTVAEEWAADVAEAATAPVAAPLADAPAAPVAPQGEAPAPVADVCDGRTADEWASVADDVHGMAYEAFEISRSLMTYTRSAYDARPVDCLSDADAVRVRAAFRRLDRLSALASDVSGQARWDSVGVDDRTRGCVRSSASRARDCARRVAVLVVGCEREARVIAEAFAWVDTNESRFAVTFPAPEWDDAPEAGQGDAVAAEAEAYAAVMAECLAERDAVSAMRSQDRMERGHVPHGNAAAREVADAAASEVQPLMSRAAQAGPEGDGRPDAAAYIRAEILPALRAAREAVEAYDAHRFEEARAHAMAQDATQATPVARVDGVGRPAEVLGEADGRYEPTGAQADVLRAAARGGLTVGAGNKYRANGRGVTSSVKPLLAAGLVDTAGRITECGRDVLARADWSRLTLPFEAYARHGADGYAGTLREVEWIGVREGSRFVRLVCDVREVEGGRWLAMAPRTMRDDLPGLDVVAAGFTREGAAARWMRGETVPAGDVAEWHALCEPVWRSREIIAANAADRRGALPAGVAGPVGPSVEREPVPAPVAADDTELPPPAICDDAPAPVDAAPEELRAFLFNAGKAGLFVHITGPRAEHTVSADHHIATTDSLASFALPALSGAAADAALAAAGWERFGEWDGDRSAPVRRAAPAPVVRAPLMLEAAPVRLALPAGESAESIARVRAEMERERAARVVAGLGWSRHMADVVDAAACGGIYAEDDGTFRTVGAVGKRGRKVKADRMRLLLDAGYLTDQGGLITASTDGREALRLVRLVDGAGIHNDDKAARADRFEAARRRNPRGSKQSARDAAEQLTPLPGGDTERERAVQARADMDAWSAKVKREATEQRERIEREAAQERADKIIGRMRQEEARDADFCRECAGIYPVNARCGRCRDRAASGLPLWDGLALPAAEADRPTVCVVCREREVYAAVCRECGWSEAERARHAAHGDAPAPVGGLLMALDGGPMNPTGQADSNDPLKPLSMSMVPDTFTPEPVAVRRPGTRADGRAVDGEGRPYREGWSPAVYASKWGTYVHLWGAVYEWDGWWCDTDCATCATGVECADCTECTEFAAPFPPHWARDPRPGEPYRGVEIFGGPGGMSKARSLVDQGGEWVLIEFNPDAAATARAAGHWVICADVRSTDPRHPVLRRVRRFHGSPPCQTLSSAGLRAAWAGDAVAHLRSVMWQASEAFGFLEVEDLCGLYGGPHDYFGECMEGHEDHPDADRWNPETCGGGILPPCMTPDEYRAWAAAESVGDERTALMAEMLIWPMCLTQIGAPLESVTMEQSANLIRQTPELAEAIQSEFLSVEGMGWAWASWQIADAADTGAASHRERAWFVALSTRHPRYAAVASEDASNPEKVWGHLIKRRGYLPDDLPDLSACIEPYQGRARLPVVTVARALEIPHDWWADTRGKRGINPKTGKPLGGGSFPVNTVAQCVTAPWYGVKFRPADVEQGAGTRVITREELAALVGFPWDYPWRYTPARKGAEGKRNIAQMIADAVSPFMLWISSAVNEDADDWYAAAIAYQCKLYRLDGGGGTVAMPGPVRAIEAAPVEPLTVAPVVLPQPRTEPAPVEAETDWLAGDPFDALSAELDGLSAEWDQVAA